MEMTYSEGRRAAVSDPSVPLNGQWPPSSAGQPAAPSATKPSPLLTIVGTVVVTVALMGFALAGEVTAHQREMGAQQAEIHAKDNQIQDSARQIVSLRGEVTQQQNQIDAQNQQITKLSNPRKPEDVPWLTRFLNWVKEVVPSIFGDAVVRWLLDALGKLFGL